MTETLDEINCFISYHRPDNRDYLAVVDRIKAELSGRFEASTGRTLNVFLDRDSIGWGEDWRERIHESVLGATFFIPVITMRFFRSDACREELTTYYENAKQLGVTELILPVVLAGAAQITSTHDNEDVRLIEKLNYIPIEMEWEAGYESPEWRGVINRMVRDLTRALAKAENALVERETFLEVSRPREEEVIAEADLGSLIESVEATTSEMQLSLAAMTDLGGVLNSAMSVDGHSDSPAQRQVHLVRGAKQIGESATRFSEIASRFESGASETDAQLRAVVRELRDIDSDVARTQLATLDDPLKNFPDLSGHIASIDEALGGLRVASLTNVSMRKALQPAIRGMQSMRIGMNVAQSWSDI